MGYGTNGISFSTLREANKHRLPQFKNGKGEPAHAEPDGSDWTLGDWMMATVGELGELGNLLKKVRRGDISMEDAMPDIRREFADVITYLDIFASQLDINLSDATRDKFNEVSRRVGASVFIGYDDDWHMTDPDRATLQSDAKA